MDRDQKTLVDALFPEKSSIMVVAAHPDDEVIGFGGMLCRRRNVTIVKMTDGVPRDMRFTRDAGFQAREDYAAARHRELIEALRLVHLGEEQIRRMGFIDQEIIFHLVPCAQKLMMLLRETRPAVIVTHPYEGGHPDHDGAAFSVYAACRLLARENGVQPQRIEFTSYHLEDGKIATGFLAHPEADVASVRLTEEEQEMKKRMFSCFRTQQEVLHWFSIGTEKFRRAPQYDFARPPHPGPLLYETFNWGIRGADFNKCAVEAMEALGLEEAEALACGKSQIYKGGSPVG